MQHIDLAPSSIRENPEVSHLPFLVVEEPPELPQELFVQEVCVNAYLAMRW